VWLPKTNTKKTYASDSSSEDPSSSEQSSQSSEEEPSSSSVESSSENSEDDWEKGQKKSKKSPSANPLSTIVPGSRKRGRVGTASTTSYKTVSGIEHTETEDDATLKKNASTQGLKFESGYRNPATNNSGYKSHNQVGLSVGQQGLNSSAFSHGAPSWGGMRAGKDYLNGETTSQYYNSNIEKEEKKLRKNMKEGQVFNYDVETEQELIKDKPRAKEIALLPETLRDENRIAAREKKLVKKFPEEKRVVEQRRVINTDNKGTLEKLGSFTTGTDLKKGMLRRFFDQEAQDKYVEARGGPSQGSDHDLSTTDEDDQ
jgi:hypothetical protein